MIKKSNKYNYIQGKQLTDPGSGTRVYDIDNSRLPSVTTILGATKNTEFLKKTILKESSRIGREIKSIIRKLNN